MCQHIRDICYFDLVIYVTLLTTWYYVLIDIHVHKGDYFN
jgi:hypothetical protein